MPSACHTSPLTRSHDAELPWGPNESRTIYPVVVTPEACPGSKKNPPAVPIEAGLTLSPATFSSSSLSEATTPFPDY